MANSDAMPPDRYGSTILPRASFRVGLGDGRHPIQISGRWLRCEVHSNPVTSSMLGFTNEEPECVALSRDWHTFFASTDSNETYEAINRLDKKVAEHAVKVTEAMVQEIAASSGVNWTQAKTALESVPQARVDPGFLSGIPPWAFVVEWAAYKHTKDDSILPYFKIHVPLNLDLKLMPEELSESIHTQTHDTFHRNGYFIEKFTPQRSNVKKPIDLQKVAIALPADDSWLTRNHVVSLNNDGEFICHLHREKSGCDIDMRDLNSREWSSLPEVIRDLVMQALSDRLKRVYGRSSLNSIDLPWRNYPKAWARADLVHDFIDHHVRDDQVPAFIAYGVTPEQADRWSFAGCYDADRVALCEFLAPYRDDRGDGYVVTIAEEWTPWQLKVVLPILSNNPEQALEMVTYQEAGWSPRAIVGLIQENVVCSGSSSLSLPPPEVEIEEEMDETVVPLAQIHDLVGGEQIELVEEDVGLSL